MSYEIGETRRGFGIGMNNNRAHIYSACPDCGRERWVLLRNGVAQNIRCHPCGAKHSRHKRDQRGPNHWKWKGGRHATTNGYVEVWIDSCDPYFQMAGKDGFVYEHRIVMARVLKRCLVRTEEVHHKNHDKHDNRIDNLELTDKRTHAFNHATTAALLEKIKELETEVLRLNTLIES